MLTAPKVKRPVACEWIGSRAWKTTLGTSDVAEIWPGIVRSIAAGSKLLWAAAGIALSESTPATAPSSSLNGNGRTEMAHLSEFGKQAFDINQARLKKSQARHRAGLTSANHEGLPLFSRASLNAAR